MAPLNATICKEAKHEKPISRLGRLKPPPIGTIENQYRPADCAEGLDRLISRAKKSGSLVSLVYQDFP